MSVCKLCGKGLYDHTDELRGNICKKCVPQDETIVSAKLIYDKEKQAHKYKVKTKVFTHNEIVEPLFKGFPKNIMPCYKIKVYYSI